MSMRIKVNNHILIAYFDGDMDHHTALAVREKLDQTIRDEQIIHLIFDFSKLKFMDSSGIGVIIGRYKLIQSRRGKMVITGVSKSVTRLLTMSGIHKLIPFFENTNEALKAI